MFQKRNRERRRLVTEALPYSKGEKTERAIQKKLNSVKIGSSEVREEE